MCVENHPGDFLLSKEGCLGCGKSGQKHCLMLGRGKEVRIIGLSL